MNETLLEQKGASA